MKRLGGGVGDGTEIGWKSICNRRNSKCKGPGVAALRSQRKLRRNEGELMGAGSWRARELLLRPVAWF